MKREDYKSAKVASLEDEISAALGVRYGAGVNEFWLSNGQDKFPSMSIVVNGDLASLSYFPKPRDPGYRSVGCYPGLDAGGCTTSYMNSPEEEHEVSNDAIVPYSTALKAAQQFATTDVLPTVLEWFEL